jgi:hypothetical protein
LAQRGAPSGAFPADLRILVRLRPRILDLLGLGRPSLHEPDRREDDQRELEELGLPVLHHVPAEVGRDEVAAVRDRLRVVRTLLVVVGEEAGDRLPDERQEEDREEEERQALLEQPTAHQWWIAPMKP